MNLRCDSLLHQVQSCRDMFLLRQLLKNCESALSAREKYINTSSLSAEEEKQTLLIADIRDTIQLRLNQLARKPPQRPPSPLHVHASNTDQFVDYMCYMLYRADCLLEV